MASSRGGGVNTKSDIGIAKPHMNSTNHGKRPLPLMAHGFPLPWFKELSESSNWEKLHIFFWKISVQHISWEVSLTRQRVASNAPTQNLTCNFPKVKVLKIEEKFPRIFAIFCAIFPPLTSNPIIFGLTVFSDVYWHCTLFGFRDMGGVIILLCPWHSQKIQYRVMFVQIMGLQGKNKTSSFNPWTKFNWITIWENQKSVKCKTMCQKEIMQKRALDESAKHVNTSKKKTRTTTGDDLKNCQKVPKNHKNKTKTDLD